MKIIPLSSALLVMLLSLVSYAFSHPQKLEMPTRDIKTLGLKVPFLGLGTVELGRDWGIGGEQSIHPDEYRAKKVLQKALQVGYTLVDSASSYQLSEERIGRYIPQHSNRYLLITKPGEHSIKADDKRCKQPAYDNIYCAKPASEYDFSHDAIVKDIDNSLKLLKVKTLDVALLHLNNKDAENILAQGIAVQ
ncbi:MAG: aldo/keto reductase, partial [Gammaproteobacteria bacterium]|nr:aldo/keto reductase [Gammaproteobacteria bacterium]